MDTIFVGLKELRQNMAGLTQTAVKKRQRVIVLKKNRPLFELRPLSSEDTAIWEFRHEIEQARESARKGNVYSTQQVRKMLGLKSL